MKRYHDIVGDGGSDERIEAYVLYVNHGMDATEILSLRSVIDDDGARVKRLLPQVAAQGMKTFRFRKGPPR